MKIFNYNKNINNKSHHTDKKEHCHLLLLYSAVWICVCGGVVCVWFCVCQEFRRKKKKWKDKLGIFCSFRSCHFKTFIYSLTTSIQWQVHSLCGPCTLCYPKDLPEYSLISHLLFAMENVCPKVTYSEMKSNYVILWEINNAQCVSYSSE